MIEVVRAGSSVRAAARRAQVSPRTVLKWVRRCEGRALDECDLSDRPRGAPRAWNRVSGQVESQVMAARRELGQSLLGEHGAGAIRDHLQGSGLVTVPSVATINRILARNGALQARGRTRRLAPPPGWYLPEVAAGHSELDSFDLIEELKLKSGPQFSVLTAVALHARQVDAWPDEVIGSARIVERLIERWRTLGLPAFAQFDNDTRFQGAHQFANTIGRVSRLCLALGIIPVFAPPLEHGFQNAIEGFNGLWQAKVWQRFHFEDLSGLRAHSQRYVQAHRARRASALDTAPARHPFPLCWELDLDSPLKGSLIYLRRTNAHGNLSVLGHHIHVHPHWQHRLVRCEVNLDLDRIQCFALRRRDPQSQPLLAEFDYHFPQKRFHNKTRVFTKC